MSRANKKGPPSSGAGRGRGAGRAPAEGGVAERGRARGGEDRAALSTAGTRSGARGRAGNCGAAGAARSAAGGAQRQRGAGKAPASLHGGGTLPRFTPTGAGGALLQQPPSTATAPNPGTARGKEGGEKQGSGIWLSSFFINYPSLGRGELSLFGDLTQAAMATAGKYCIRAHRRCGDKEREGGGQRQSRPQPHPPSPPPSGHLGFSRTVLSGPTTTGRESKARPNGCSAPKGAVGSPRCTPEPPCFESLHQAMQLPLKHRARGGGGGGPGSFGIGLPLPPAPPARPIRPQSDAPRGGTGQGTARCAAPIATALRTHPRTSPSRAQSRPSPIRCRRPGPPG